MFLPWPIRPMFDYAKQRKMLHSALGDVNRCSDAMGPLKQALARTLRWPSGEEREAFGSISTRLTSLCARTDTIKLIGASVPPNMQGRDLIVGEHAANSSTTRPWGDVLFQLTRTMQPHAALEMGTCVGMSGSYIAAAMKINNRGHLWTLEGLSGAARIAEETFSVLGLKERTTVITGRFLDTLDDALKHGPYRLAFIDGHHEGDATVAYYRKIKPHLSGNAIVLFDDIDWSRSMQEGWREITTDKDIRDHATLMGWGAIAI